MKFMDDPIYLAEFAKIQQQLADSKQSEASQHQRAADAARKRIKQLKREKGNTDGKQG